MIKIVRALAIVLVFSFTFISCSKKPTEVVKEYEIAFNSHSINKLMSLFNDNAVIQLSLLNILKGKARIKGYAEYDSVLNSQITVSDIAENDDRAFFIMSLKNDLLKTIGIDEAKYSMIFKISGGKIDEISGGATNETDNKLKGFRNPFMLWAASKRLDVLNEIMPNGNIIYNAENAKKYLALVFEWKRNNMPAFVKPSTKKKNDSNK
jgi:hypothetical protein